MVVHVRQPAAQQRLHDDGRNTPFFEFTVKIFGVGIPIVDFFGVFPVDVIELDLHEIPFDLIVPRKQVIEDLDIAVIRESQVSDTSRFAFGNEKIEHPVIEIASFQRLHTAHTDAVKQQVVEIIDLQLLERIAVHRQRSFPAPSRRSKVRQFGGNQIFVARMTAQRNARCAFRTPFTISGRRIEIVDAVRDGVIDQRIDHLLVDLLVAAVGNGRPAHTTVPQQRHAVARSRISAVGHLIGRNLALRRAVARRRIALRTATGQRNRRNGRSRAESFQKFAPVYFLFFYLFFHEFAILNRSVIFVSFDIDRTERTRRAKVFARAAADAPLFVHNGDFRRIRRIGIGRNHRNGSRRTMASAVAAIHPVRKRHAVLFHPDGMADLNRRFFRKTGQAYRIRRTNLGAFSALRTQRLGEVHHRG